ncbi:ABC transporter substrate-binding protein [Pleomorphomonas koreensis]|uniref:ABC transporter substrate-binding protein n=1 Tax=Pleomorphomonas koreensis TaxID=257440 RepID=UPI0003FD688C|nr:sugar ABC transporter substrate-binding protein [Pleomorphomonas koreensis]
MRLSGVLVAIGLWIGGAGAATAGEMLTIAAVDNADMIRMRELTDDFMAVNPGIHINWVMLEESVLRQKVATDIETRGGQFDIMTIGNYEVPIWARQGWLTPLTALGAKYDVDDLLPAIRKAVSYDGKLYASPFYGESAMLMYRTDLFRAAGLEMPPSPTWSFVREAALKLTDKAAGRYGICLRGKAGWGENMAFLTAAGNSFGARWFDPDWRPEFRSPEWRQTLDFYVELMQEASPPGAAFRGYADNLDLFRTGGCAIWIDSTVAASTLNDPKTSSVVGRVGYAPFPTHGGLGNHGNWLWTWNLAIPAGTTKADAAQRFIAWATDRDYAELVAAHEGWAYAPPGTRTSLYNNPSYRSAAPFSGYTLNAINTANPDQPTVKPVPYTGSQFVAIPEFQRIGNAVGQIFAAAVVGQMGTTEALSAANDLTLREMKRAGYIR